MLEVARLESHLVHYKENGQVLKGQVTPLDRGLFQINLGFWGEEAAALGLDVHNIVDNVKMARHIYDTQGISAWVAWNTAQAQK
jgi:hypothetical protein